MTPVEVYLTTVYRPDCDFVEGEILERNFGDRNHGRLQAVLGSYFYERRRQWKIGVFIELRLQMRPDRFRVADICVVLAETRDQVMVAPPFLCVEILSPEDRIGRVQDRIHDYFEVGVPNVWIIDPSKREAFYATPSGNWSKVTDVLRTNNPSLEVPLAEIFE
jgi:Uma2 family endonuclease